MSSTPTIFTATSNNTALHTWNPLFPSPAAEATESRKTVPRARDLWNNNPIAKSIARRLVDHTIGSGPRLVCQPDKDLLGLDDDFITNWTAEVEGKFRLDWTNKHVSFDNQMSGAELCKLALIDMLVHGDTCIRYIRPERTGDYNDRVNLKIQIIEGTRIKSPFHLAKDPDTIEGVTVDTQTGEPSTYWISTLKPNAISAAIKARDLQPFPRYENGQLATDLIFLQTRPGQYRGQSVFTPIVEHLKMMIDLDRATIRSIQVSHSVAYIITTEDPKMTAGELDGNPTNISSSRIPIDSHNVNMGANAGRIDSREYYRENSPILAPGRVLKLLENDKIQTLQTTTPGAQYSEFRLGIISTATTGTDCPIPASIVMMIFQGSYSAARGEKLEFERTTKNLHSMFTSAFPSKYWEAWLDIAVAIGYVDCPGYFLSSEIRRAWLKHSWGTDAPGHVDPTKEANYWIELTKNNLASYERAISALHGIDAWEEIERIARETNYMKELDLQPNNQQQEKTPSQQGGSDIDRDRNREDE